MVEINTKPPRVDVECSPNKKQQLKNMDVVLPIELSGTGERGSEIVDKRINDTFDA